MRQRTIAAICLLFAASPLFAAVTGTLMNRAGQPVAGARIALLPFEPLDARAARLMAGGADPEPLAVATSDAKGAFSLPSPKEPTAELRVEANGFAPLIQRVENDEDLGAVLLRTVERKTGRVTANGKPVPNARVIWWSENATPLSVSVTDAEGRYSAPDPRGTWRVTVLHPDFAIAEEIYGRGISQTRAMDRTLAAGREAKGIVYANDGKTPAGGATILVDGWPVATSADDGTFTISRLPARWRSLAAVLGAQRAVRRWSSTKDNMLTFRLEKGATIRGTTRDVTRNAVPGALVSIVQDPDERVAVALSDAKGNYSVVVPAGTYRVTTSHPSFAFDMSEASVAAGQQATKDAALVPYARISGTVIDDEQRPVAAATLTTEEMGEMMMFRGGTIYNPSYSGPDGRFTLKLQADRELRVKAVKKGLPDAKSDPVRLAAGERKRNVVITIPSGVAVTGRITDRDGNPISGVSVTAAEADPSGSAMRRMTVFFGGRDDQEEVVRTGSDGTFAMRLREGTYDFTFRREGYSSRAMRAQQVTAAARPIETALDPSVEIFGRVTRNGSGLEGVRLAVFSDQPSEAVTGPDGSFTLSGLTAGVNRVMLRKEEEFISDQRNITAPGRDVVIELPPGGTVSGRVVDKSSRKPVTSFQAGISTSRGAGGMMMVSPPMLRPFTSEDGSFTLENVPAGAVNIVVQAPGYAQGRKSGMTLEEGKTLTDVEVELEPGVRLVGRVTAPDGSALAGVTVREAPISNSGRIAATRSEQRTTTEASGEYVLDTLEAGEKTLEFSHPRYISTRKTVELKGREVRLDVRMEGGARITGTVVTDSDAAVPEARVEAVGGAMTFGNAVRTDAAGNFTFESLPPGRYTFRAARAGYASGEVEDVDVSTNQNIRITLGRGGVIYGRVIGLSEAELPYAIVDARGPEGSASAPVDQTGNYRIEGAPHGPARVSASVGRDFSTRKTSQVQSVQLEPGGTQQVDLEFRTDVVVRGRVTRDGRPLTGGSISFFPRNATASTNASGPIDEQGLYSISGLEEGEYNITVTDTQRLSPYQTTHRVRGSTTFDIDYRTISVRGRVVDASTSEPVADARVQLRPSTQESMMMTRGAVTDSSGNFAIDFVPAGSYSASAEKDGYGTEMRPLQVSESSAPDLDFRLARADGILLNVVDARDGRPVAAYVRAVDAAGQVYETPFRIDSGPMRLPVAPGSYRVTVAASGYAAQTVTMTAPSRQTVALTRGGTLIIRSREGSRRRGRLLGPNGPHIVGRMMTTWFPIEPNVDTPIAHIPAGRYSLQILGDNDVVLDQTEVVIVEGQSATVDL